MTAKAMGSNECIVPMKCVAGRRAAFHRNKSNTLSQQTRNSSSLASPRTRQGGAHMKAIGSSCLLSLVVLAASAAVVAAAPPGTTTPIRHLVVIFQENNSFDHYFATYPVALNPPGEPPFSALEDTPTVNGLGTLVNGVPQGVLLTDNPNANNPANNNPSKGAVAINPFRLDRSQAFLDCNN